MENTDNYDLKLADAIDWLKTLPSLSVNTIVTDPPYESLEKHRSRGTTTRLKHSKKSSNNWFDVFPNSRFEELFNELYRVLKKDSHVYIFSNSESMFIIKPIGEAAGFKFWKPIVWDKMRLGLGYHFRAQYEFILFFEKGKRKLKNLSIPDVLRVPRIKGGYPTEKPTALIEILINQSTEENALVCDPFFGSGSVGVAALNLSRRFIGCDISKDALELAEGRMCHQQPKLKGIIEEDYRA